MAEDAKQVGGHEAAKPVAAKPRQDAGNRDVAKNDPTMKANLDSGSAPDYPEGTHPIHPLEDQDFWAGNKVYEDMPDDVKPHSSTVAQVELRPEEQE